MFAIPDQPMSALRITSKPIFRRYHQNGIYHGRLPVAVCITDDHIFPFSQDKTIRIKWKHKGRQKLPVQNRRIRYAAANPSLLLPGMPTAAGDALDPGDEVGRIRVLRNEITLNQPVKELGESLQVVFFLVR
jgi:hypothetical protein